MIYKPAPLPGDLMGHVNDNAHVRQLEVKYGRNLVGYSAKWTDNYRVYVWDDNQWCGVFPMTADDVTSHDAILRISKTDRWTKNFTPPTEDLTSHGKEK